MALIEHLLRAAVGTGTAATAAWEMWVGANDLEAVEPAELRLLPVAYRNLVAQGVDESRLPAIARQMLRTTWIRTRLLVREAVATAAFLDSGGVPAMLLKGAALVAAGDLDAGLRPMSDFDVLVHSADAIRAATLLEGSGWRSSRPLDAARLHYLHAAAWKKGDSVCDLHWRVAWETRDEAEDESFWRASETVRIDGMSVRVPSPAHHLLHTIVHGTRRIDKTTVRWIPDAIALLRSKRAIDWDAFLGDAKRGELEFPVGEALAYLADAFEAPVPREVTDELRAKPVEQALRRIYAPRPEDAAVSAFAFPISVYYRSRRREKSGGVAPLMTTARTLQHTWDLPALAHLPFEIARRITRRFMRRNA